MEDSRDHFESRLENLEKASDVSLKEHIESRLASLEKATELARFQMEKRLEGMNEVRAQLKEQAAQFISRAEYDSKHERLITEIRDLRESRAELQGKASQKSLNITLGVAIISLVIALVGLVVIILMK